MTKLNRYSFLMLTMGLGFCENAFSALRQYDPQGTPTSVPVRLVDSDYELKNTYYIFKVLGDLGKKSKIDLSEFFDIPGLQTRYYNLWVLLIGIDETVASVPSFTKPEDIGHVRDEDLFQSRTDHPTILVEKLNRIIEAWQSGETIEEVSGEELKLFNNLYFRCVKDGLHLDYINLLHGILSLCDRYAGNTDARGAIALSSRQIARYNLGALYMNRAEGSTGSDYEQGLRYLLLSETPEAYKVLANKRLAVSSLGMVAEELRLYYQGLLKESDDKWMEAAADYRNALKINPRTNLSRNILWRLARFLYKERIIEDEHGRVLDTQKKRASHALKLAFESGTYGAILLYIEMLIDGRVEFHYDGRLMVEEPRLILIKTILGLVAKNTTFPIDKKSIKAVNTAAEMRSFFDRNLSNFYKWVIASSLSAPFSQFSRAILDSQVPPATPVTAVPQLPATVSAPFVPDGARGPIVAAPRPQEPGSLGGAGGPGRGPSTPAPVGAPRPPAPVSVRPVAEGIRGPIVAASTRPQEFYSLGGAGGAGRGPSTPAPVGAPRPPAPVSVRPVAEGIRGPIGAAPTRPQESGSLGGAGGPGRGPGTPATPVSAVPRPPAPVSALPVPGGARGPIGAAPTPPQESGSLGGTGGPGRGPGTPAPIGAAPYLFPGAAPFVPGGARGPSTPVGPRPSMREQVLAQLSAPAGNTPSRGPSSAPGDEWTTVGSGGRKRK